MPQRPIRSLAVVGVLALGDYLLWNWSLGANHDVVALVAGMILIPLLIALAWLAVVAIVRLLARAAKLPKGGAATQPHPVLAEPAAVAEHAAAVAAHATPAAVAAHAAPAAVPTHAAASPSSKLAA